MNEEDYWKYYEVVRADLDKASYCYYAAKEIRAFAHENRQNRNLLNDQASFWNTTLHGLQIAWFMALSRLFDRGSDTHTMKDFLRHTVNHPEFFVKDAFDRRRMKEAGGIRPDYLDNYVANIWIPTRVDLNDLTRRLRPYRRKWNSDYIKIRDQVFAHTIAADLEDVAALFSRTVITDIEDIFQGLHDILDIVWELWTNGRHPNRHKPSMRSIEDVVEDTRQLLRKL